MFREEFSYTREVRREFETQGTFCPRCGSHVEFRLVEDLEVLMCVGCGFCFEYTPRQMALNEA